MPISGYGRESTQSAIGITEGSSDMDVEEYGASPNNETQEELVLSEVVSRREENVKHFDLGHGRFQAVAYGNAVHRKDENGVWQDIDNRLYPAKDRADLYATADGRTTVSAYSHSSKALITLRENGYVIALAPVFTQTAEKLKAASAVEIQNHKENIDLVLKPYTGSNNQKWKITLTSYGSYKIKAKSSESITDRDLVMVVQTNILYSEGLNIQQRQYVDNTSYKDEWNCIRMLPTNGYELAYDPSAWAGIPSENNNCYAYALNNQVREPVGNSIWFKQQPGEYYNNHRGSCAPIPQGYQSPPSVIVNSVQQDFNKYNSVNGTSLLFTPIGRYETCPVGTYKVALVVSNSDYHWYRQDADGLWSHKRGTTPVKRTDESGELIIDPMIADRDDYSTFVGFFAVKPWNNIYNSSKGVTLVSEDVISTTINDTQLSNIQIGMTYSEVTETLNSKGIDIGSGSIIQQYRSSGGVLYTFEYASTEVGFIVSKIIIGGEGK